jgi:hypothetical protein
MLGNVMKNSVLILSMGKYLFTLTALVVISSFTFQGCKHKLPSRSPEPYMHAPDPQIPVIVKFARQFIKCRYLRFGNNCRKGGIDSPALIQNVLQKTGIIVPRNVTAQANFWKGWDVGKINNLQIGDLIFFSIEGTQIDHVGIITSVNKGAMNFIHSYSGNGFVQEEKLNAFWGKIFRQGKRFFTKCAECFPVKKNHPGLYPQASERYNSNMVYLCTLNTEKY